MITRAATALAALPGTSADAVITDHAAAADV